MHLLKMVVVCLCACVYFPSVYLSGEQLGRAERQMGFELGLPWQQWLRWKKERWQGEEAHTTNDGDEDGS